MKYKSRINFTATRQEPEVSGEYVDTDDPLLCNTHIHLSATRFKTQIRRSEGDKYDNKQLWIKLLRIVRLVYLKLFIYQTKVIAYFIIIRHQKERNFQDFLLPASIEQAIQIVHQLKFTPQERPILRKYIWSRSYERGILCNTISQITFYHLQVPLYACWRHRPESDSMVVNVIYITITINYP